MSVSYSTPIGLEILEAALIWSPAEANPQVRTVINYFEEKKFQKTPLKEGGTEDQGEVNRGGVSGHVACPGKAVGWRNVGAGSQESNQPELSDKRKQKC